MGIYDVYKRLMNVQDAYFTNINFTSSKYHFTVHTNGYPAYVNIYDYYNLSNNYSIVFAVDNIDNGITEFETTVPHKKAESFNLLTKDNHTYFIQKMTAIPSSNSVNITINEFNTSKPAGQVPINFTASSINDNNVTFIVYSLVPRGKYVIKRDGGYFTTEIADSYGCIRFNNSEWLETYTFTIELMSEFGTGDGTYPSIMGIHNGTIIPSHDVYVNRMYTYPCAGTGGHSEYVKIWNRTWFIEANWTGYKEDWHNITFDTSFILLTNETYYYKIETGSYPQIIHNKLLNTTDGKINCEEFKDANGKKYDDWIPAIRLYSA